MRYEHSEIECRFLEVDEDSLKLRLKELNAQDLGPDLLEEVIFYGRDTDWRESGKKFVRVRKTNKGIFVTYKHHEQASVDGTEEIEFQANDMKKVEIFLDRVGLDAFRHQQKKRHTYILDGVTIDFDTWPRIPTYVELEGDSEESLKRVSAKLGLNWNKAVFDNAREVIVKYYNIQVHKMKWFTFDRFE